MLLAIARQEPASFVLAGRVDALDPPLRTLRIGREDFTVAPEVSLDGLTVGARVVLSGRRDPETGRGRVQHIVPSVHGRVTNRTSAPHASPEGRELLALVVALLIEVRSEVQAVECELRPLDRYAVLVRISGEISKEVLLPRQMLERALVNPTALRSVRNLLRASVEILRSQRTLSTLRETRYRVELEASSWTGPRCERCGGALFVEEPIVVQGGVRRHMACPPSW
jgi:hypothetical protein